MAPQAQCEEEMPLEQQLEISTPWIIYFDTTILRPYLVYAGSKMYNPLRVGISYKRRNEKLQWSQLQRYEELWFKNGKAIGLKRYTNLAVSQDGVIFVKQSSHLRDSPNAPKAIGNAIARVVLDVLATRTATLRTAYVPKDIFEEAVSELSNLGFSEVYTGSKGRTVTIHLLSYPQGFDLYLRHRNMISFE